MNYDPVLYDSDNREFLAHEINFYINLIKANKPESILELGVGSGRIFSKVLALVKFGVGIDIDTQMLSECAEKCKSFSNFDLVNHSFVDFNLDKKFDFIYIPFNTFQHILTKDEQKTFLLNIKRHMHSKSIFILDLMNPDNISFDIGELKYEYTTQLPNGLVIERSQKTLSVDPETSVVHKVFEYKQFIGSKLEKTQTYDAFMRINPNQYIQDLLVSNGFVIENTWSDYFFSTNLNTKKMIYFTRVYDI
jgi:SAM-dependent methyltransferase